MHEKKPNINKSLLPAYLDGTLDDAARQQVRIELEQSSATQKLLIDLQADEERWQHDRANLESVSVVVPSRHAIRQILHIQRVHAQRSTTRRLALGGLSATVLLAIIMLGSVILLAAASVPATVAPTSSVGGGSFVTQDVPPPTVPPEPTATLREGVVNYITVPPEPTLPPELNGKKLEKDEISLIWPLKGQITRRFGDGIYNGSYAGLSILATQGTPVIAAMDGVVAASGWERGFGNRLRIRHAVNFETVYGHLPQPSTLTVGQKILRGQVIGYVGSTADNSEPHLFFQSLLDGKAVDPLHFLP